MTNKLHIVLTDFLLPANQLETKQLLNQYPTWVKMLARGTLTQSPRAQFLDHLQALFSDNNSINWAGLSAKADKLPCNQGEIWLRADPVHLLLQRDKLLLIPNVVLSELEAKQFCEDLTEHFSDRQFKFFAPHPQRWYIQLPEPAEIITEPLVHIIGKNIQKYLPQGKDGLHWNKLLNEMQMYLFSHKLNQQREEDQELAINSIWPWGYSNKIQQLNTAFQQVSSNNEWSELLANATNTAYSSWQANQIFQITKGEHLLVLTELTDVLHNQGWDKWQQTISLLEKNLFKVIWSALKSNHLNEVQFDILGKQQSYQLSLKSADKWKIWRRATKVLCEQEASIE